MSWLPSWTFLVWTTVISIIVVIAYVVTCVWKKVSPDLGAALNITAGVAAIIASIRIMGAVASGSFEKQIVKLPKPSLWQVSDSDGIVIFVGGLALMWVSILTAYKAFTEKIEKTSRNSESGSANSSG